MRRIFIWLRAVAAGLGCLWLVVTCTPLVKWWTLQLAQPWGNCQGDVLIVLGGSSLSDDVLGASSYWRAVYAVRVIREHHFQRVIISGGNGSGASTTAESIRNFIAGHNIDTSPFLIGARSLSTRENATETRELLGPGTMGKLVLLTSDYHVWRAVHVFHKAGLEVDSCPVPDAGKRYSDWQWRAPIFVELVQETSKIVWYGWHRWI